jgi:hypothetical protein
MYYQIQIKAIKKVIPTERLFFVTITPRNHTQKEDLQVTTDESTAPYYLADQVTRLMQIFKSLDIEALPVLKYGSTLY